MSTSVVSGTGELGTAPKESVALARPVVKEIVPDGLAERGWREFVWLWLNVFASKTLDDFSPKSFEEMIALDIQQIVAGSVRYGVYTEDSLAGAIWFQAMGDGMFLGHLVFQRFGIVPAQKKVATAIALADLFASGTARKVIWMVFADNRAFLIFLRRLGAVVEGRFRENARRNGQLVDVVYLASFPERKVA